MEPNPKPNPTVGDFMRYESDEMTPDEEVAFIQKLINNGQAWTLQGHYGRVAKALLDSGVCTLPEDHVGPTAS